MARRIVKDPPKNGKLKRETVIRAVDYALAHRLYRPGQKAPYSGLAEIVGANGDSTGAERTVVKGEPFPPTPRKGQVYRIVDKVDQRKQELSGELESAAAVG